MKDSNSLVKQSVRDVEALKKTSQTEAGPSKQQRNTTSGNVELQNAINQVFALFRINFHNQYHAAFGDTQLVNQAKKLWLESLARFTPQQVLMGARQIIEQSEYLPTLHRMINCCEEQVAGEGIPPERPILRPALPAVQKQLSTGRTPLYITQANRLAGTCYTMSLKPSASPDSGIATGYYVASSRRG